ncbi:fliD [Acrasis kona]|uniref:FliD n=1 Tax=Acrasis kona TaxID=1008807 RepID=A0AAW2YKG1_9EUKA
MKITLNYVEMDVDENDTMIDVIERYEKQEKVSVERKIKRESNNMFIRATNNSLATLKIADGESLKAQLLKS